MLFDTLQVSNVNNINNRLINSKFENRNLKIENRNNKNTIISNDFVGNLMDRENSRA